MKHKKVQVIVFSDDAKNREVLLLQTNAKRGGFWQNITGSVEKADQNLEAAASRELKEETQLSSSNLFKLEEILYFVDRFDREIEEHVYYCSIPKKNPTISKEHQDFKWVKVEEVDASFFGFPNNFQMYQKALKRLR